MENKDRWLKLGIAAFALAIACAAPQARVYAQQTPVAPQAGPSVPSGWRVAEGRTPDPSLVYGTLPNGMRYILRKGVIPPGQVSIRLALRVGSMHERDDEQGMAHFLEHMAFRGTKQTPDGEMIKRLERLGLRMGADANAGTGAAQTTFMLNLAKNDDASIDAGLGLLCELMSDLTLDPAVLEVERGVVLAEVRQRGGAGLELQKKLMKAQYGEHPYSRSPGGDPAVIQTFTADRVRAFYDAWYRPERAAIVIAGDMDPSAVQAKLTAVFGSWQGRGPTRPDPAPIMSRPPQPDVQVFVQAGGSPENTVRFFWYLPYEEPGNDKVSLLKSQLLQLGRAIFQGRIRDMTSGPNQPFRISNGYILSTTPDVSRTATLDAFSISDAPAAIDVLVRAHRQFMEFGFTQAELDHLIKLRRDGLARDVDVLASMPSPQVASAFVSAALEGVLPTNRAEEKAWFEEVAKAATPDGIMAVMRETFGGEPVLIYSGGSEPAGGEAGLRAAWEKAKASPVEAYVAEVVKPWPYTDFGRPGTVATRRDVADLGVTYVTFKNGLKLTFKPMPSMNGLTLATLRFGYGKFGLPKDSLGPADFAASLMREGGLGKLTETELRNTLAGKGVTAFLSQGTDAYAITNAPGGAAPPGIGTRDAELDLLFQVFAARLTDPAWRTDSWDSHITGTEQAEKAMEASVTAGMAREGDVLLHGGDLRWAPSTAAMQRTWKPADTIAFMKPIADTYPLELVVVGDVKVERVIEAVSKSLGALPARAPRPEPAGLRDVKFPAGRVEPIVYPHKARPDQAQLIVTWPTTGAYANTKDYRTAMVLVELMRMRLADKLRAQQGKTYSPATSAQFDRYLPTWGRIGVGLAMTPDLIDEFAAVIFATAEEFKTAQVSADELARAKGPLVEAAKRAQSDPSYWMAQLPGSDADQKKLDFVRTEVAELEAVTAADVMGSARRWLDRSKSLRFHMTPAMPPQ